MEEDTATQQHEVQRKMGRCHLVLADVTTGESPFVVGDADILGGEPVFVETQLSAKRHPLEVVANLCPSSLDAIIKRRVNSDVAKLLDVVLQGESCLQRLLVLRDVGR